MKVLPFLEILSAVLVLVTGACYFYQFLYLLLPR